MVFDPVYRWLMSVLVYTPTTTSTTCAAEDRDDRTLQSVTRSWDEIFLHTATAFHTTVAFQLVLQCGQLPELEKLALPQDAVRRLLFDTPKWQHLWCRHCHLQVQFCHWLCLTTSCPLPHGGLCRTANMQSWLRCGRLVNRLQWSVHGCQIRHG